MTSSTNFFPKQRLTRRWDESRFFNIFHYQISNDGGYWTIRWTEVSTAGFVVVPYNRGVTETIKRIWLATALKLLKNTSQTQNEVIVPVPFGRGTAITKGKTPVPVCSPKLSPVERGWYLGKILCAVLLGKSGWRSGHQSRLPPLLQCCMWIEFQSISTWLRGFPPGTVW